MAKRVAKFLRDTGLIQFAYRCDREPSILALMEAAILASSRQGIPVKEDSVQDHDPPVPAIEDDEPDAPTDVRPAAPHGPTIAVPELTHPGESQSNGLSERAVQAIEDQARTIIVALEARVKMPNTLRSCHCSMGG